MRKGFTLIELLGVIIILSMISIIVTPAMLDYVNKSKISAYRTSVQSVIDKAKEYVSKNEANNDFPEGGINIIETDLNLKKNKFVNGIIERTQEGEIVAVNVYDGTYCANGTKDNLVVEKVQSLEECNKIDTTAPTLKVKAVEVTSNKIMVVALAKDEQSGIKNYKYCIGEECYDNIERNNYEFSGLKSGQTYEITVTARNNNSGKDEQYTSEITEKEVKIKVTTLSIEEPTFEISSSSYAGSKEITIKYGTITEGYEYGYEFIDENGNKETRLVTKSEEKVEITKNGTLKAYIRKDEEEISNEIILIGIDSIGPEVIVILNDDKWEKNKQITVMAKETGIGLSGKSYSYDGGKSWTNNNKRTYIQPTTLKIVVRDKLGNKTAKYKLCKDNTYADCYETEEVKIEHADGIAPSCKYKGESTTWTNSDRIIQYGCSDSLSGCNISYSGGSKTYTTTTKTDIISEYIIKDNAGNQTTCEAKNVNIYVDKTPPACGTITLNGTLGINGWYRSNVTIGKTNGTDANSGHLSTTIDRTSITSNTNGTKVTLTTKDNAGNTCTTSKTIKVDKTPPTCGTITVSGTLGNNGWYRSNVTIGKTNGSDANSGHLSTTIDRTSITSNTNGTKVTLTTKDNAGNTCTTSKTIKVDKTPPTIEMAISGTRYGSGYQSGAKVTITCKDNSQGVSGGRTVTLTTKGMNNVSGTCTDIAGNKASDSRNYLIYVYSSDAACGYNVCQNSACGISSTVYRSCATAGCGTYQYACGTYQYACGTYNCNPYACNPYSCNCTPVNTSCNTYGCYLYKKCATAGCGTTTTNSCGNSVVEISSKSKCTKACKKKGGSFISYSGGACTCRVCRQVTTNKTCRDSACGSEYVTGSECNNAQSKSCISYNTSTTCQTCYQTCYQSCTQYCTGTNYCTANYTCRNAACGVEYYVYNYCPTAACGYATCWHT